MSRPVFGALVCLAVATPAAAQITRVSVSTAGIEANAPCVEPAISRDGRFVAFSSAATNLVAGDTNGVRDVFVRDRDTDADGVFDEPGAVATTRVSVAQGGAQGDGESHTPVITPDGRYVVFESSARNLAPAAGFQPQLYRVDRLTGAVVLVTATGSGEGAAVQSIWAAVSDDGNIVAFASTGQSGLVPGASDGAHLFVRDIAGASTSVAPAPAVWAAEPAATRAIARVTLSGAGSRVAYLAMILGSAPTFPATIQIPVVADLPSGAILDVPTSSSTFLLALSASGSAVVQNGLTTMVRRVLATGATARPIMFAAGLLAYPLVSPSARYALQGNATLHDFDLGLSTPLGIEVQEARFSGDDRWLAIASTATTLVGGDVNGVSDVFVLDLPDVLDADNDGMEDRWETLYGVTDPNADPDNDGQTNAQEENAGTHPNGAVRRYLAEGATGTFFNTTITLANPDLANAAVALVRVDRGDGTTASAPVSLPAAHSAAIDVGSIPGFEAADVSMTIESDRLVAVDRHMAWDTAAFHGPFGYGSHSETATASPSTTWFLAEGSTVLEFNLFYLLQNPQAAVAHTTVRFLLPDGTVVTRSYDLAPHSRTTIYVNQVPGLDETDVSGDISSDVGIIVERSMYRNLPGQPFGLGTDSMGVTAPATRWFLAEGATGTFFDQYVLIANPGNTDALVTADYASQDGTIVTRQYTVRAHSRFSVFVDAIPGLESTSLATTVTSTNSVPIVVERAMYWPNGFFSYYEGHSSAGSTITAQRWVVADGHDDLQSNTYVLIANTENRAGEVVLTALPRVNEDVFAPPPLTIQLPPNSRTTVPIYLFGTTAYGVLVTSTGPSPVALVVESAAYRSTDVVWSSGSNALATPVP